VNSSELAKRGLSSRLARILILRQDYLWACDGSLAEAILLQAIAWQTRADDPDAWLNRYRLWSMSSVLRNSGGFSKRINIQNRK
jgi:hypothetical protein